MPNGQQQGQYTAADVQQRPAQIGQYSAADVSASANTGGATGSWQPQGWLSATGDALKNYAEGFGQGALQDVAAVSRGLNKIPSIGEMLAPSQGVNAERILATPTNTAQKLGAGTEQIAELMTPSGELSLPAKIGLGALKGGGSVAVHEAGTSQGANPADVGLGAAFGAGGEAVTGGIQALAGSKLSRGMINESMMATARDVTYGNPAKALLDEDIAQPFTGDLEKFKSALRSGATLQGASEAAGGRIAAVSEKINEIAPQLQQVLAKSTTKIPANVVTDTIDQGIADIMKNRGITASDAWQAVQELQAIKQAALKVPAVPGATAKAWAPLEANALKQEIGQSVDWAGRERVGQLVEPIKKQIYGSLRDAVNAAAPGAADLNERLTNLLAAQSDINKLAGFEEVGRGRSMGGVIGPNWMGKASALAGRLIPGISWLAPKANIPAAAAISGMTQFPQQVQSPVNPDLRVSQ